MTGPTALIAEDEPLLAAELARALADCWPALKLVSTAGDGESALEQALALRPDIAFLDIRMPGLSGLEVAEALAEDWPDDTALPLIVYVTAYDQYAVGAFERGAVDYLLKPVDRARLAQTCARLQSALGARPAGGADAFAATLEQLRRAIAGAQTAPLMPRLTILQASVGNAVHVVPVAEVIYFEAADKYVRVVTAARDYLIRLPLRQLVPQLEPDVFWQVHRGTVVRADAIATAVRDETGRVEISLRDRPEKLAVSRLHAHLFRGM